MEGMMGDEMMGDGIMGEGTSNMGDGMGEGTMEDTTMDDGMMGNGTMGDGMMGDGMIGNEMTGDGMMHDGTMGDGMMHDDMNGVGDMMDHSGVPDISSGVQHNVHGVGGTSNGFCTGEVGMVMFMDGFRWALKGDGTCLNLYFPGWTLDTRGKFVAAMFGVVLLAICTEAISRFRHNISVKQRRSTTGLADRKQLGLMQIGLHGLHAFTGYILMLATMTFSLELLVCVITGLVIGYILFGGDTYNHVTTNPCCAFLEDEANERDIMEDSATLPHQVGACCETKNDLTTVRPDSEGSNSTELRVQETQVYTA
jgi:hypothetical protein